MQINEKVETARIAGAAVGITLWGLTLNEWVAVATIFYMLMQVIILAPRVAKNINDLRHFIRKTRSVRRGAKK